MAKLSVLAAFRDVERFPDVPVNGSHVLRDSTALSTPDKLMAQGHLMEALRYLPIDLTCGVPSPEVDKVAAETGQETRLAAIRDLRVTKEEREGGVKPRTFGVLNRSGRVVGALELMSIVVVRETEREIGLRARSFPAFQFLLTGNPANQASYVPWVRAHTMAIRALMQAEFPGPDGKVARLDSITTISNSTTGNPLCLAYDAEVASLVAAGTISVSESPHPRIPETTVRVISPR